MISGQDVPAESNSTVLSSSGLSLKSNFIASYNLLRGQIESDVENMKKYLGMTGK